MACYLEDDFDSEEEAEVHSPELNYLQIHGNGIVELADHRETGAASQLMGLNPDSQEVCYISPSSHDETSFAHEDRING